MSKQLLILGTRGIPAQHGGFETFAQYLALYLKDRDWDVSVYCQHEGTGSVSEAYWQGIRQIITPVKQKGALGTILFDLQATLHARNQPGLALILGYNTAIFNLLLRPSGKKILMNMDGIEWKRDKWNPLERRWLYLNERLGSCLSDHLIADHPEIKAYLKRKTPAEKITMIPYGAATIECVSEEPVHALNLEPKRYTLVIARPEPENSILEIVRAFSRKEREHTLVVLGDYQPEHNTYHSKVVTAASSEVYFAGAIYDSEVVHALRSHARLYVHGHQVGGTNPSLVEALGAGNAVLAHSNPFNHWVAGEEAAYFEDEEMCARAFDRLLGNEQDLCQMERASRARHQEAFLWTDILAEYEQLLERFQL